MDHQHEGNVLFSLQGPDEHGCVWISSTAMFGWRHNVGPADKAAEVLFKVADDFGAGKHLSADSGRINR